MLTDKFRQVFLGDDGQGNGLIPLGEVIHRYDGELEASGRCWQRPDDVDSQLCEGLRAKNSREPLWMSSNKRRVPLALFTFLRVISDILLYYGPIQSLQQYLVCEGLPPSVIPINFVVNFTEDFLGLLIVEASKQRDRNPSLVQLVV